MVAGFGGRGLVRLGHVLAITFVRHADSLARESTPLTAGAVMLGHALIVLGLTAGVPSCPQPVSSVIMVTHTYEARIRFNGKVSTTQVQASDAGQAKKLVQAQFPTATVLSVKKVD